MKYFSGLVIGALLLLFSFSGALSGDTWTKGQLTVIASIERLSASTGPEGTGADQYGAVLHKNFSRWTSGSSKINHKQEWVKGISEWFDDGWRVAERDQQIVEISIQGEFAFTRRIVEETYVGPEGESSVSKSALTETWLRADDEWLLYRVNVDVLDNP